MATVQTFFLEQISCILYSLWNSQCLYQTTHLFSSVRPDIIVLGLSWEDRHFTVFSLKSACEYISQCVFTSGII
ncbi:mCG147543 [Mus musculus]|nr:mCG147543 [Mus musculus]